MRLLVDTQCWLWMTSQPQRFSKPVRDQIAGTGTELLLSAASAWEIAIKHALGKLTTPEPPDVFVPRLMAQLGITPLPVLHRHALHVATLPPRHRDPFDRLLVAQAQLEEVPILTADPAFGLYEVDLIPA